jgi:hypothetical protein
VPSLSIVEANSAGQHVVAVPRTDARLHDAGLIERGVLDLVVGDDAIGVRTNTVGHDVHVDHAAHRRIALEAKRLDVLDLEVGRGTP